MKKGILLVLIAFAAVPFAAQAQFQAGIGYMQLSEDVEGTDISIGGMYGSIAYSIPTTSAFSNVLMFKVGTGISDDSVAGIRLELDRLIQFAYRGEYAISEALYAFFTPSYANAKVTASAFGISVSDDSWEFGVGAGVGIAFTERVGAELSYERFSGTGVFSIGARINF